MRMYVRTGAGTGVSFGLVGMVLYGAGWLVMALFDLAAIAAYYLAVGIAAGVVMLWGWAHEPRGQRPPHVGRFRGRRETEETDAAARAAMRSPARSEHATVSTKLGVAVAEEIVRLREQGFDEDEIAARLAACGTVSPGVHM